MPKLNPVKERFIYLSPTVQAGWEDESNINDFEGQKQLGIGAFGKVLRVLHKKSQLIYAVKEISKKNLKLNQMVDQVSNEVKIMYSLNHPYILKQYNHFEDNANIYLVLEYAPGGQLYAVMWRQPTKCFGEKTVAKFIFQLAKALEHVHGKGIIHRDIKPENILLDKDENIKLADFGWSNFKQKDTDVRKTFCGTLDYLAPEMLTTDHKHDFGVDIWSVGVLCYELITGSSPFAPKQNQQNADFVEQQTKKNIKEMKYSFPDTFPVQAKDLISKILILNSKDRISLQEIYNHPWIQGNNENCKNQNIPLFENIIERTKEIKKVNLVDEDGQSAKAVFTQDEIYKYSRPDSIINKEFTEKPSANASIASLKSFGTSPLVTGAMGNSDLSKQVNDQLQHQVNKLKSDVQGYALAIQKKDKEYETLKQQFSNAQAQGLVRTAVNPLSDPIVLEKLREKDQKLKEKDEKLEQVKKEYDYLKQRFTEQDLIMETLKKNHGGSSATSSMNTSSGLSNEIDKLKDDNIYLKSQLEQLKSINGQSLPANSTNSLDKMMARITDYRVKCEKQNEEIKSLQEQLKQANDKSTIVGSSASSTGSTNQMGDLDSYLEELKQKQLKQYNDSYVTKF